MNSSNVISYITFAYWALKSKQSIQECFKLDASNEAIEEHVNKIINDDALTQELCKTINYSKTKSIKKKESIANNTHILQNMEAYNTTADEAQKYELHCHNCGKVICIGDKYCDKGCFKFVEDFNYDCYWGKSCKMCHTHKEYIVATRNFEFFGKTYWIDNDRNVYNDENEKIAIEREGKLIYI
jgi:hypothetical protein